MPLGEAGQIARGEDPAEGSALDHDAVPRRWASSTTASRIVASERSTRSGGPHDVLDPQQQLPAERAAGMEAGEVLARESLLLEQRHRQRVAERQRGRGARRRREVVRAGLLATQASSATVAVRASVERSAGERDGRYAEAL